MRLLWALDHALQVRSKRMLRTLGLTGPQRLVLRLLGRSPGLGAAELAARLHTHPSTLTGVLQRLQQRSIIRREIDAKDGRRIRLWLTASGARLNQPLAGTIEDAIQNALSEHRPAALEKTRIVIASLVRALLAPVRRPRAARPLQARRRPSPSRHRRPSVQ